ncbi:hypothetical protein SAMN04515659_0553 [Dyella sp. 333MFSha]|nr:hypothetical protein SAMN04515659_0553 [Dyella sp. 333MFSha]
MFGKIDVSDNLEVIPAGPFQVLVCSKEEHLGHDLFNQAINGVRMAWVTNTTKLRRVYMT